MFTIRSSLVRGLSGLVLAVTLAHTSHAVPLADAPIFSTSNVPGNLALPLSVEYPTAISVANLGNYVHSSTYLGYFDPAKCYTYTYVPSADASTTGGSYFKPAGLADGHTCSGKWSGNFLNWVSMQTIDPFRWALTGGYRDRDTTSLTILQKAYGSRQGSQSNFPLRGTAQPNGHKIDAADLAKVVPLGWSSFTSNAWGQGTKLVLSTGTPDPSKAVEYGSAPDKNDYFIQVRVQVCDNSSGTGGVESNCVQYGSHYKPEGLMQKYANKIRYSVFSYLTQGGDSRQGGVMRSKMGFIGPTHPVPLSTTPAVNALREWDASTGIMQADPLNNPGAAADPDMLRPARGTNSGTMNYVNQFGNTSLGYETYDNVSELYYAVMRYFQNLGNVPEWSNGAANYLDGFPIATKWDDPMLYSCQKNFVLGIGDNNTHFDVNTGGGTLTRGGRTKPSLVSSDPINKSADWTSLVERAEGLGARGGQWGNNGSEYMAGLAYGNHVYDMRPDLDGKQTISTFWMDVMEYQVASDRNPYWLAAKYGGFRVPGGFDPAAVPTLTDGWWTNGEIINMNGANRKRPNNYFLAGNAGQMVEGLTQAFNAIANAVNAFTTAVTPSSNVLSSSGTTSYSSSYGSEYWSGLIKATTLRFTDTGPAQTEIWSSDTTLAGQFSGSGWDTGRIMVTWNKVASEGIPFRLASLPTTTANALDTSYVSGNDAANYLNYLRGDKTHEVDSTATGSMHVYRTRTSPLGDIVNSKLTLSPAPRMPYTELNNPGYAAFKSAYSGRTPLLLVGANDGMLHALNAGITGTNAGKEVFAFVPAATFYGPGGSLAGANTDGLAALGNPSYSHRFYVDATPQVFDVDFHKVDNPTVSTTNWRTIVVGGMGKGGKGFFALDITDPSSMTTEAAVSGKVLWEISNATAGFDKLGYSYGAPILIKTAKYGWTLVLTSGYNNADNVGYLFLVNPATGALLETISTGSAAPGLAQASAFINDYTDGTADAIYAGDLNGRLWRFNLTGATGSYPAPEVLFQTASPDGGAQPITVAPIPEVNPTTRKRTVLFGTGKLLDGEDILLSQEQSFYAITDGDNRAFESIAGVLDRTKLTQVSSLTTPVSLPDNSRGWYFDLGKTNGIAWRVNLAAAAAHGVAVFTSTLTSGDACSPSGRGRAYAVDYSRGASALDNNTTGYVDLPSAPTDTLLMLVDGQLTGVVGHALGGITDLKLVTPPSLGVHLVNWRELNAVE